MPETLSPTGPASTGEHLQGILENFLQLDNFHKREEIIGSGEKLLGLLNGVNPPDGEIFGSRLTAFKDLDAEYDVGGKKGFAAKLIEVGAKMNINKVAGGMLEEMDFLTKMFNECKTPQEGRTAVANFIDACNGGVESRILEVKRWARKELMSRNLAIAVGNMLDEERFYLFGQMAGGDKERLKGGVNISALRVNERYARAYNDVWRLTSEMIWG
jgi:hypothetical protein